MEISVMTDAGLVRSKAGLMEAHTWLRRQASTEKEPKARAAFVEAANAILKIAED
jgi:hypothetical protein